MTSQKQTYNYVHKRSMKCPQCGKTINSELHFNSGSDAFLGYSGVCKCGYEPAYG